MTSEITAAQAKAIVSAFLTEHNLPFAKLTAKRVSFVNLARDTCMFVKVHGWQPDPKWNDLRAIAKEHGFCVEA
jgi:hypothetical protein